MQTAPVRSATDGDALLGRMWRTLAGLLAVLGVIYVGTALVEAVLPALPDQARANAAVHGAKAERSGAASTLAPSSPPAAAATQWAQHFHTQFQLEPDSNVPTHVENF